MRDVDKKSIVQLSRETQALIQLTRQGKAKNTVENVDSALLHPGVVKYYREQNLIKQ